MDIWIAFFIASSVLVSPLAGPVTYFLLGPIRHSAFIVERAKADLRRDLRRLAEQIDQFSSCGLQRPCDEPRFCLPQECPARPPWSWQDVFAMGTAVLVLYGFVHLVYSPNNYSEPNHEPESAVRQSQPTVDAPEV